MAAPLVRLASADDAEVVGAMLHDFNVEFETATPGAAVLARRLRVMLGRDDVFAVLVDLDGETVAFALLTTRPTAFHDGPLTQLEELYVRPRLRDRGLGTAIMERLVVEVRARSGNEIHINVDEIDHDTRRFYERHGFSNLEAGTDYRMLCYIRELEPPDAAAGDAS